MPEARIAIDGPSVVIARYSGLVLKRRMKKPAVGVITAAPNMYAVASH